jgi:hypothetical protein
MAFGSFTMVAARCSGVLWRGVEAHERVSGIASAVSDVSARESPEVQPFVAKDKRDTPNQCGC